MAANPKLPSDDPEQHGRQNKEQPEQISVVTTASAEDQETMVSSIQLGSVAQVVIAIAAILGIFYVAKLVLITLLTSILIAFMLEPIVAGLEKVKIPRIVGAVLALSLLLGILGAGTYFFFNRAIEFSNQLPRYSEQMRGTLAKLRRQTAQIQKTTEQLSPTGDDKKTVPVEVKTSRGIGGWLGEAGGVGEIMLTVAFIPFLVFFMITWKDHARRHSVMLFTKEHRMHAHRAMGEISAMMRAFLVGNFIVGMITGLVSAGVFFWAGIPYALFLGIISGFVSLIPYLGLVLALVPPITGGIGEINRFELLVIAGTVLALHLIAVNVLYPKIIGKRLDLNPLVVTIGLLFWGWIWGAMGLVLAVPIIGAMKIVFDRVPSLKAVGAWLGE